MTFAQPFKDYELLDRVGAGAMGTVFKARQKRLGRIVALKVLKPSLARDERYVDRLKREARIVASLSHPHIVTGYDLGEENGFHFFVMEFVEGRTLRELLAEWGMFPEQQVLKVGLQASLALDHAYQRGVIHRDVKPGNILIDEAGNVKLTDMGLAKGPADLTLTRDGATVGTPQYISPEQAKNPQDVDVRSDLYSLGATLYHMATGVPPFAGSTMAEVITKVLHDAPVSPRDLNPALSEGLSLVLRKLLAKDLRIRYQTPRELLDDLERVRQEMPPEVDESRLAASERGPQPSVVLRSLVVTGVCIALLVAAWVGMKLGGDPNAAPKPAEFLAQLDADLQALAKPGEKWERLRKARTAPPPDTALDLTQRERAVLRDLGQSVDAVAAHFLGPARPQLTAWLREPARWPDRDAFEHELLKPRLRAETGLAGEPPADVGRVRLDELLKEVARELADRDADLLARLSDYLARAVPERADERLRNGDFAGAFRLWDNALAEFCDGVKRPLAEKLDGATARTARERHFAAKLEAEKTIERRETVVAGNLVTEARAAFAAFEESLQDGLPPDEATLSLERVRSTLKEVYPPSTRFRLQHDPWPDIEAAFGQLRTRIALAAVAAARRRIEARCDSAWRAVCAGEPADGLAVLQDLPGEPENDVVVKNRDVIAAAQQVHDAILRAIERSGEPLRAFPRTGSGEPVELRTVRVEGKLVAEAQRLGQPRRPARLTEFRFDDLFAKLRPRNPFAGIAQETVDKGRLVLAFVSEDPAGIAACIQELQVSAAGFLLDDVWPRIRALREREDAGGEAGGAIQRRLRQTLARAKETENPEALLDLEETVDQLRNRFPELRLGEAESGLLREAVHWLQLEKRRLALRKEVRTSVPIGADVAVTAEGSQLHAKVAMPAHVLHKAAKERWQLHDGVLTFVGSPPPWSEQWLDNSPNRLDIATGLEDKASTSTVTIDLKLPPASLGRRLYLFDYRGIGILIALTGDDTVHAEIVDGDMKKEEVAQRAFVQSLATTPNRPPPTAIPGGVHRLVLRFVNVPSHRRAAVSVEFEKRRLCDVQRDVDPARPPRLSLYPQQQISIASITVTAQVQ